MSGRMRFFGAFVYESETLAKETARRALDGGHGPFGLSDEDVVVYGVDIRFDVDNFFPSVFFDRTMIAISEMSEHALSGTGGGACGEFGEDDYESRYRTASALTPKLTKPLNQTQERIVQYLLTGKEKDIRRAHRIARVSDIPTLGRVWKALSPPILQARMARVFIGRKERRAQIIGEQMATFTVADSDPHADEIRKILNEFAQGVLLGGE